MRPVKCNGKLIGYAIVEDGRVTKLDLEEEWILDLPKGVEHEVIIELDSTLEADQETNEPVYFQNYLSSKFTL